MIRLSDPPLSEYTPCYYNGSKASPFWILSIHADCIAQTLGEVALNGKVEGGPIPVWGTTKRGIGNPPIEGEDEPAAKEYPHLKRLCLEYKEPRS